MDLEPGAFVCDVGKCPIVEYTKNTSLIFIVALENCSCISMYQCQKYQIYLNLVKFVMCTLVSRVHMTFCIPTYQRVYSNWKPGYT